MQAIFWPGQDGAGQASHLLFHELSRPGREEGVDLSEEALDVDGCARKALECETRTVPDETKRGLFFWQRKKENSNKPNLYGGC